MYYEQNGVKDLQIAYIGGGSRGWAWKLMADLALEKELSGTIRLYDIDWEAAKNNEIIGNKFSVQKDAAGKWEYKAVESLETALTGADFVIISILPGTFEEMRSDVHEPEKYGIYQSVGDTVGPGGLVRALRTIPQFVEIAQAIEKFSPNAWVINYTNPMTLCVRTLYEVFPKIKAFGCCHEVFGTERLLTAMIAETLGIQGVSRDELSINVMGINHFTWIDRASYQGYDLIPLYRDFSDRYYEEGYNSDPERYWETNTFAYMNRVKFDLFRRYGVIAAAGDRHLAEFCPPWYLKDPETVKSWKFGLTTVDYRINDLHNRLEKSKKLVSGTLQPELKPSGEEGVLLLKALLGIHDKISNVNIPNYGQIPNLPRGAVVETNALFCRNHISPIFAGNLPHGVDALVTRHVLNQESALQAALRTDREAAFQVFLNDPLVNLSLSDGRKLFDAMLENTRKYLPKRYFS